MIIIRSGLGYGSPLLCLLHIGVPRTSCGELEECMPEEALSVASESSCLAGANHDGFVVRGGDDRA